MQFQEDLILIYMQDQMQIQVKYQEFALIKCQHHMLLVTQKLDTLHTQNIIIVQEELISIDYVQEEV